MTAKVAAIELSACSDEDLTDVMRRVIHLPEMDLSLQVRLPDVLPPSLERLASVLAAEDHDAFDAIIPRAVAHIDSPVVRETLARAILRRRDEDRIDPVVAAFALVDLAADRSMLLVASVVQSLAVAFGESATPTGLVIGNQSEVRRALAG